MLTEIRDITNRKTFTPMGVTIWDDTDISPTTSWYAYICPDCGKVMRMLLLSDKIYIRCECGREYEKGKVFINY